MIEVYLKAGVILLFIVWNVAVFAVYSIDKNRAKKGSRRISEKTLLLLAAFLGGLGALVGMKILRHKTKHKQFTIGVPLLLLLNIAVIALLVYMRLNI